MKKVFEKIKNSKNTSKVVAVVLATAVCATSIWHGFVKKPAEVVAAPEVAEDNKSYLSYVVDRMIGGLQEKFTILEIVPHESQGEFRYYIGDDRVEEGLEKNRTLMEKYYSTRGRYIKHDTGQWDVTDVWYDVGNVFSNFGYQFIYYSEEDRFEVESPKRFLNYVLPEYKELFEGNIDLRTVEGNDLTEADILAADFIIISTGTHDNSTIGCYNAFTDGTLTEDSRDVPEGIYKGTINADGTGNMTPVTAAGEITYNTYEMNADGTYKSRDISWEMVELLWEYTINGKPMELSDGTVVTTAVPVIMDNQQFSNLNKDGNMYKYELLFRMLTKDQFATIKPYISNVDVNGNEYINCENLNTGVFDLEKAFAADADVDMIRDNIYKICGTQQTGEYKDNNPPHAVYLTNDYWVFSGDSCLIPSNKDASYGQANVGFEERTGNPTTVIEVMRYLLGAKDTPVIKYKRVKILEIQPCTVFDYDTYEEVKKLSNRLLLATDGMDNDGNMIYDPLTEDNYNDPNANTCIYVECISSAGFNGINDDIVADYDVIILGDNDDLLLKDDKGKTIYNDTNLNGYIYLAFGDLIKCKTGISVYYPEDYKELTTSKGYWGSVNYGYTIGDYDPVTNTLWNDRQTACPVAGITSLKSYSGSYTKIYKMDTTLWNPLLYNNLTAGKYYILENANNEGLNASSQSAMLSDKTGLVRLSGNDITQIKCNQLKEFVDSGKLLVMGEEIYNYTDASTTIYPTSNIAEIAKYAIDKDANRIREGRIGAMLLYLRNLNPKILNLKTPTPVEYDAAGTVNKFNEKGTDLPFSFSIDALANTTYQISVYGDKNNDGVYNKSGDVTDDKNERYHRSKVVTDADGKASVSINVKLPEEYNGIMSYRLEVVQLSASGAELPYRAGVTGYTAIKGKEVKNIHVLQILPVPYSTSKGINLNMETDAAFNQLINNAESIIGYNIEVDAIYTEQYENWFNPSKMGMKYNPDDKTTDRLYNYDMVVLGFADLYCGDDISNDNGALDCLNDFISKGKSVLFTHDTIGYSNTVNGMTYSGSELTKHSTNTWATSLSRMFRDVVGMDRFGISDAESLVADQFKNIPYYKDGTPVLYGLQGVTNMLAYRHSVATIGNNDAVDYEVKVPSSGKYLLYPYTTGSISNYTSLMETTKVTKLNDGQVTMYPYAISDSLTVAETHSQWYQLDMEDPEIVVWYTLAGDGNGTAEEYDVYGYENATAAENASKTLDQYYIDNAKDAGNNYYIYSKNNITYSGAGHSSMDSPEELKLFVNTVVKAISAGNSTPDVKVLESSYANGLYNVFVTPFAETYEFKFYGYDGDLLPYVGKFADAKVTWHNPEDANGDGTADADDYVTAELGKKVVNMEEILLSIGGESTFTEFNIFTPYADQMSQLIEDGYGVTFTIELTDMFGAKGTATIRLLKRELYKLD
ncbi:MAG: DUF5057 domain-containing protein [Lachnospiraceae bacterium]|nr:DUF5057 domain-containing protein [Lachnospiraceae bacterium]